MTPTGTGAGGGPPWWRDAVTYQLYLRSFADGDGDGVGDIDGVRARLPHLVDLGVDALWINPWYVSPQRDGGYDVADYRDIDPLFGDLRGAEALIDEAHAAGLRVILDLVPNHSSDRHPWFRAALAAGPGSRERRRYVFRDGRGPRGDEPPNNWPSVFGGPAWTRVTEPDGSPGQWYLHLFAPEQPDFDWDDPDVRREFLDVLRFWFDRGADGFRIDVAHGLAKHPEYRDMSLEQISVLGEPAVDSPCWDQPGVHDIYRSWRAVADSYDPPRMFVAEAWVATPERLADYLRPDELHTAFDFSFVRSAWAADDLRRRIQASIDAHTRVGAPVTWTLSNHDITRHVSRFGRPQELRGADPLHGDNGPTDLALGTRRARAAALLLLALPGAVYLYQGEELGLPEVEDLPDDVLQDPVWERSGHRVKGRDGCRVPLPWTADGPSMGFGPSAPWLPQPPSWRRLAAEVQRHDPASMLSLYRRAIAARRRFLAGRAAGFRWLDLGADVLAFSRDGCLTCVVNLGASAVPLPPGTVVLVSDELGEDRHGPALPPDTAAWIRPPTGAGSGEGGAR